ncbi:hypothetical protein LOTGIDRAFT_232831 [Lottia gigantea]|uniref:Uncharacterized protein n=1 Tax=Lottia gigantea TaxID=225164 RepID=V4BVP2_LOTGI|nr:hypothetical protein LOTGIDRAFT_232831 [Lottia gigantea]ESO93094.1 hypothetical protein LOTGIDRAFT_232831 [Lottia gigantea]
MNFTMDKNYMNYTNVTIVPILELETILPTDSYIPITDHYLPPSRCGNEKCREFFMEFIYICVIPTSVLIFLAFILSLCFCCSHSKRSKKTISVEEQQRYDTIRRASKALRRMSYTRDTPLLEYEKYGTMTLDRSDKYRHGFRSRDSCYSAPGTLQKHRNRQSAYSSQQSLPPPPVYRLPPQYSTDDPRYIELPYQYSTDDPRYIELPPQYSTDDPRYIDENNIPMVEFENGLRDHQAPHAATNNGFI